MGVQEKSRKKKITKKKERESAREEAERRSKSKRKNKNCQQPNGDNNAKLFSPSSSFLLLLLLSFFFHSPCAAACSSRHVSTLSTTAVRAQGPPGVSRRLACTMAPMAPFFATHWTACSAQRLFFHFSIQAFFSCSVQVLLFPSSFLLLSHIFFLPYSFSCCFFSLRLLPQRGHQRSAGLLGCVSLSLLSFLFPKQKWRRTSNEQ